MVSTVIDPVETFVGNTKTDESSSGYTEAQVDELRRELAAKEAELVEVKRDRKRMKMSMDGYREVVSDNTALMAENRRRKDENAGLKKELEQRKNELREHKAAQEGLQRSLNEALQLLETRTSELKAAQSISSKPTEDPRLVTDVVQLVQDLNSVVVHASALLAESLSFKVVQRPENAVADQEVSRLMGPLALRLLKSVRGEKDIKLLKALFSGCIIGCAYEIITSWHFSTDFSPASAGLDDIYGIIYSQEEQTHRKFQRGLHGGSDISKGLSRYIANSLSGVIVCARLSGGRKDSEKMVMEQIGTKLASVTALAHKLNKIIDDGTTSADLKIIQVYPNAMYDPSIMDDANDEGTQHQLVKVSTSIICTTGLGLSVQTNSSEGKRQNTIVLKPKVALEDFKFRKVVSIA